MRKALTIPCVVALVLLILSSQLLFPVVANSTITETSVTEMVVTIEPYGTFNVTIVKTDIYKGGVPYVAFNVSCRVGRYFVRLEAPPYPAFTPLESYELAAIPSDYKYQWDGITFVKAPGPPDLWIKYNHPDVYDTYNIGVNENKNLQGNSKIHSHIARYLIENAKSTNDLGTLLIAATQFIVALLAAPGVGWISAAIAAVIVAALFLVNRTISYFLNDILQDERGGGWMWTWGFGSWLIFKWFYVSFGAWRDWSWFVFIILHGGGGGFCRMM